MKKILVYQPNHLDGVSFYRVHGPLGELEKQDFIRTQNYQNRIEDLIDWTNFTKNDIVIIQRPSLKADLVFVEMCRKYGLKIWFDIDDDILHLPDDNAVYTRFSNPEAIKVIEYTAKNANVITTASPFLKRTLEKDLGVTNVVVLPNAIPPQYLKFKKPFKYSKKIVWRGTESHIPELLYHESDLIELINRYRDWEWVFMGLNPYFIHRKIKNPPIKFTKGILAIDFINAITQYNAPIQFNPLLDTKFHRAKSNLAWMDASLAGSVCLGPDFEEWQRPGLKTYKCMDQIDFISKLEDLICSEPSDLEKNHNLSWAWIKDNIMLEKINGLRKDIINGL